MFQITRHGNAHQTNYISTPSDFTATSDMPIQDVTAAFLLLTGIEVEASAETGGIVVVGDSRTDCNPSRLDANNRWPDQLIRRLIARSGGRRLGVMNQGLVTGFYTTVVATAGSAASIVTCCPNLESRT